MDFWETFFGVIVAIDCRDIIVAWHVVLRPVMVTILSIHSARKPPGIKVDHHQRRSFCKKHTEQMQTWIPLTNCHLTTTPVQILVSVKANSIRDIRETPRMNQRFGVIGARTKLAIFHLINSNLNPSTNFRLKRNSKINLDREQYVTWMCTMKFQLISMLGETLSEPLSRLCQGYIGPHADFEQAAH
jgi:hypothetical protein